MVVGFAPSLNRISWPPRKNCHPEPSAGEAEDERGICSPRQNAEPLTSFGMTIRKGELVTGRARIILPTSARFLEYVVGHTSRIMYIERTAGNLTGSARIGRVTYSKTGATIYYGGREYRSLKGAGFKANYIDVESGEEYWVSGPKKDGRNALYATNVTPEIDADVKDEYWTGIRNRQKE